jgi:hypothetical protein
MEKEEVEAGGTFSQRCRLRAGNKLDMEAYGRRPGKVTRPSCGAMSCACSAALASAASPPTASTNLTLVPPCFCFKIHLVMIRLST